MVYEKKIDKSLAFFLIIYLFFSFFMITKFPKVWIDTSWNAVGAHTLANQGRLANPIMPGSANKDRHHLAPSVTNKVLLAGIYKIFGFGLVQSRAASIFAGFFLLLLTYFFAKTYYDKKTAVLAILILISDNVFVVASRTVRADIFVALFSVASFFLFVHALHTTRLRHYALSGALLGISLYTHPNSFLVLISILAIFFHRKGLTLFKSKEFGIFTLFCFISFSPYAVYVIKEDYANHFSDFIAQIHGATALKHGYRYTYILEYQRYSDYIFFPKRLLIFLIQTTSLVYAFLSKQRINRYLALLIFLFIIILPVWNPGNRTARYFIVLMPALSILVSAMFLELFKKTKFSTSKKGKLRQCFNLIVLPLFLLLFLANQTVGDIYILWKHKDNNYDSFIKEIKSTIPGGAKIWGSTTFWIGLHDYPYLCHSSPYAEVVKFRPDYAILYDSEIWGNISATVGREVNTEKMYESITKALEKLCETKGQLVKKINDKFYGNIEIYKIVWE